jgi:hypothetical protein
MNNDISISAIDTSWKLAIICNSIFSSSSWPSQLESFIVASIMLPISFSTSLKSLPWDLSELAQMLPLNFESKFFIPTSTANFSLSWLAGFIDFGSRLFSKFMNIVISILWYENRMIARFFIMPIMSFTSVNLWSFIPNFRSSCFSSCVSPAFSKLP